MVKKLENGGELPPIKIDKNNNIIDGHHRYMAYKLSNIDKVPFEYDKIYEGIKHILVGPSEQEIWNYFGYDRSFVSPIQFINYIGDNLEEYKNDDYPNCLFLKKDGKILFEIQYVHRKLYVEYFNVWRIFKDLFMLPDFAIKNILTNFIQEKYDLYYYDIFQYSNLVNSRWWFNKKNHKNYKQVNESIKHLLVVPTEEEVFNHYQLYKITDPNELLMSSAEKGILCGVKLALEKGADVHFNNDSAFGLACDSNNFKLVKFLLENGADVKVEGEVLLQNACYFGQTDIVKILIEYGVDLHCDKDRPLRFAVENHHYDVIEILLKNGADVHINNNYLFKKYDGYNDYKYTIKLLREYE